MYCPKCNRTIGSNEFPEGSEQRMCPDCGSRLIDESLYNNNKKSTLDIKTNGDANAYSIRQDLKDSHDQIDQSQHINNSQNIYNTYQAQETPEQNLQRRKMQFNVLLNEVFADNMLTQEEEATVKSLQIELDLDDVTAQLLIDNARRRVSKQSRRESLGPAQGPVKQLTLLFLKNDIQKIKQMMPRMSTLAKNYKVDEVQHKYYMALAAINPEELVKEEKSVESDNYWRAYWACIAYRKLGNVQEAEDKLWGTLPNFESYSPENITLLQCIGDIVDYGVESALDTLNTITGNFSPELKLVANALYFYLNPEFGKQLGANKSNTAFYIENIISLKDPKAKAEEEARLKKEAEEKAKAEAERLRKEEEERQRIAAEEKRRREEEERLRKEEERRRKEEEARKAKEAADAEARKHVTYEVIVSGVRDKGKAEKNLSNIMGWHSGDCRKKLSRTPFAVKSFRDDKESAIDLCAKLSTNGMMSIIKGKNGLNEVIDCSDILAQVQNLVFEENERQRKAEEERQAVLRRQRELEVQRKAEEEARQKKEAEEKRKAEEERKRKEEEARRLKEAADNAARKRVTYTVTITGVTDADLARMTLHNTLGLKSSEARQKLSQLPINVKSFNDEYKAVDFNGTLTKGGMTCVVSAVNALGENVDCSQINAKAQVAAYNEQEKRRKDEEERLAAKRQKEERERQRAIEAEFDVKLTNVRFSAQGETKYVMVYGRFGVKWTFSAVPDNWAIVENEDNRRVKIEVMPNTGASERSDYFKIKCGNKEIRIDISQDTKYHFSGRVRECKTDYKTSFHDEVISSNRENYRLASFDTNGNGILIYRSCGGLSVGLSQSRLYGAFKDVNKAGKNIKSIDYISKGQEYCIVYGDNEYIGYGEPALLKKLKEYQNAKENILCVAMAEDNNFVVITDKRFYASKSSDQNVLRKAKEQYGSIKFVCKTSLGICVVCALGLCYDNIPFSLAQALDEITFTPSCIHFTDGGHYFIANEDGTSIKTNL